MKNNFRVEMPATSTAPATTVAAYKALSNINVAKNLVVMATGKNGKLLSSVRREAKAYFSHFVCVTANGWKKASGKDWLKIDTELLAALVKKNLIAQNDDDDFISFIIKYGEAKELKSALYEASFDVKRTNKCLNALADAWLLNESADGIKVAKSHRFISDDKVEAVQAYITWFGPLPTSWRYNFQARNLKNLPYTGTGVTERHEELRAMHGTAGELEYEPQDDPDELVKLSNITGYDNVDARYWGSVLGRPFNYKRHAASVRMACDGYELTDEETEDYLVHRKNQVFLDAMMSAYIMREELEVSEPSETSAAYLRKLGNILKNNAAQASEDALAVIKWYDATLISLIEAAERSPERIYCRSLDKDGNIIPGSVKTYRGLIDDIAKSTSKAIEIEKASATMVRAVLSDSMYGAGKRRCLVEYESEGSLSDDKLNELDRGLDEVRSRIDAHNFYPAIREAHPEWSDGKCWNEARKTSYEKFQHEAEREAERTARDFDACDGLHLEELCGSDSEVRRRSWEEIIADPNILDF